MTRICACFFLFALYMVVEDMSNNLSVVTRLSHLSPSPLSCGVRVVQSLVFWEVLCRLLFIRFPLTICIVRHSTYGSDNHFGTFKPFIVKIFYLLQ